MQDDVYTSKEDVVMANMVKPEMDRDGHLEMPRTRSVLVQEANPERAIYKGWTPSGGSKFQQSSRIKIVAIYLFISALSVSVVWSIFQVRLLYLSYEDLVSEFAQYNGTIPRTTGNVSGTGNCDNEYFANMTQSTAKEMLNSVELITLLVNIFAFAGLAATVIYLITQTSVTFILCSEQVQDEHNATVDRYSIKSNVGGVVVQSDYMETREQRRVRKFLRSETMVYMLVQLAQDIPWLGLGISFSWIRLSQRGMKCLECFNAGDFNCSGEKFRYTDSVVQASVVLISLSLFFNAALLFERWFQFFKFRREIQHQESSGLRYVILAIVCILIYIFIASSPLLILYYYEIGPLFYGLGDDAVGVLGTGIAGMIMWGGSIFTTLAFAGIDPGEVIAAPLLICEVCEVCTEPCDACVCMDCDCCCCCCC